MSDYEKYQLQWLIDHGYSLKDLMTELTRFQYDDPEDSERIATPIDQLFNEWVADVGFSSEIWACEDEWRDCEEMEETGYYDEVGGYHISATGYAPTGEYCGECTSASCKNCPTTERLSKKTETETEKEMDDDA